MRKTNTLNACSIVGYENLLEFTENYQGCHSGIHTLQLTRCNRRPLHTEGDGVLYANLVNERFLPRQAKSSIPPQH